MSLSLIFVSSWSEILRDCYQDCDKSHVWGSATIKLLDTSFWQKLTENPDDFHERYRRKLNLLEYDFVVMPMFKGYLFFYVISTANLF